MPFQEDAPLGPAPPLIIICAGRKRCVCIIGVCSTTPTTATPSTTAAATTPALDGHVGPVDSRRGNCHAACTCVCYGQRDLAQSHSRSCQDETQRNSHHPRCHRNQTSNHRLSKHDCLPRRVSLNLPFSNPWPASGPPQRKLKAREGERRKGTMLPGWIRNPVLTASGRERILDESGLIVFKDGMNPA